MNKTDYVKDICVSAKAASRKVALLTKSDKTNAIKSIADAIRKNSKNIIESNKIDLENAKAAGLSDAMIDRLMLNENRIEGIVASIISIAELPDPVGRIENLRVMDSGIKVGQMRVPVGVIAVIFESRPNVTADIAALALKSGNAAILRGGKEAINSNKALYSVITSALEKCGIDKNALRLVDNLDYEIVDILIKQNEYIDIVIPRGGEKLIKSISANSTIPVIKHDKGACHIFIDESAERQMSIDIAINAKVQRPGTCNSAETLLVHSKFAHTKELLEALNAKGVEIRGDENICAIFQKAIKATDEDWGAEYLDLKISVKIVQSYAEAVEHITKYSSGHTEAIVTSDYANSQNFLSEVDSAAVMVNASTRFHDGGEFGLGAEVGISTQKLHARGAMGIEGLTCLKYIVYGSGQVRA